jgi:hypothetical protein
MTKLPVEHRRRYTPSGQDGQVVIYLHRAATRLPQSASSRRKPHHPAACPRTSKHLGIKASRRTQIPFLLAESPVLVLWLSQVTRGLCGEPPQTPRADSGREPLPYTM